MTGLRRVRFEVRGIPGPQGSKNRGANGGLYESSRKVAPWREQVAAAAYRAVGRQPFTGPVLVVLAFRLKRPKNTPLRVMFEAKRPDVDKYVRATLDGLVQGVLRETRAGSALLDDSQVVGLMTWKFYASWQGCAIHIMDAGSDPANWPGWLLADAERTFR